MNVQIDVKPDLRRICQGDLIRNVACVEDVVEQGGTIEVKIIEFPLIVVLTQDCDLQLDNSNRLRKKGVAPTNHNTQILSVLVAPAYNATHFEIGDHLSDLGLKMWVIPTKSGKESTEQRILRQNKNPRYHYLRFDANSKIVDSVVDFKHYFAVNVQYLKRIKSENFAGKLSALYREDVSQRFASFLARIGLPDSPTAQSVS